MDEGREPDYDGNVTDKEIKIAEVGFKVAILFVSALTIAIILFSLFD